MTRKKAIEIVVANVKMGWPIEGWTKVVVECDGIRFYLYMGDKGAPVRQGNGDWVLRRKWLEEKGYL